MALNLTEKHRVSAHLDRSLLTWGTVETVGEATTLTAAQRANMIVSVTLGRPVAPGLNIEAWTHFVSDLERVQADDPARPAFFSCQSSGPAIEPRTYPGAKVHGPGSFFPYRRYAAIGLPDGAQPGARFVFRFFAVSAQTYEEMPFNLRFAIVRGEADQVIGYLGDAFYRIVGDSASALRVVAPTCVQVGEAFDCRIVVLDCYGNKSGVQLDGLGFDLQSMEGPAPLLPSDDAVVYDPAWRRHTAHGLVCPAEGVCYLRACVRGSEPKIVGVSNPIVARNEWKERVQWGDVHQHAYYGDGRGTPAANYEYAISTSCLDFCSVAPHQEAVFAPGWSHVPEAPPQTGWEEMIEAVDKYNGDELVTILGSEAGSLARVAAHMNAYYLDHRNRPEMERIAGRWWELPERPHLESYVQYLDELERSMGEFLLLPHAHARGGPAMFDLPTRPAYQTNVEICSVHGVFEEFYARWLEYGHYVGVHGSGDNHMTSTGAGNPGWHYPNTNGLAAAWGMSHSRRAIWDAIRDRKTYAVTGNQRIFLDVVMAGERAGSIVVGDTAQHGRAPRTLSVEAAGTAPVMRIDVLRNGKVVHAVRPELRDHRVLRIVWTDDWNSRRVDDSLTVGVIALDRDGALSVVAPIHAYHRTDALEEQDGAIAFRSNGYSGITRGLLARASAGGGPGATDPETLLFHIDDMHLGRFVLCERMAIPLKEASMRVVRPLEVDARFVRPLFTREPHRPRFTLEVDWVDLNWPEVLSLEWTDCDVSPAYYTVRVEQIDGNIAWSSPIWFLDRHPGRDVPGNVVSL